MWNKVKLKVEELSQTDDFNKAIGKINWTPEPRENVSPETYGE